MLRPTASSNFQHLAAYDEQLLRLGMLAERYFPEDPNTATLKLRQLTELLNLLRESRAFPTFRHAPASHHLRNTPLLEVFIAAFSEEVIALVRGGLLRQYRQESGDLAVVRGRVVTARQFAVLSNRPDRIACQFDELTADNVWNRFLKAALRAVRPWIASVDLHRRWIELVGVFDEVADQEMEPDALRRHPFSLHDGTGQAPASPWTRRRKQESPDADRPGALDRKSDHRGNARRYARQPMVVDCATPTGFVLRLGFRLSKAEICSASVLGNVGTRIDATTQGTA